MAIVARKPRNASLRFQTFIDTSHLSKEKPLKSLTVGLRKKGGRNAYGRITVRHRGGGAEKKYRIVDFQRSVRDVEGIIQSLEYDPNRNVHLGLVFYKNGDKRYILLPETLKEGSSVIAGLNVEPKVGNCLPIRRIPAGFFIHNIEMKPNAGGKLVRSAGSSAQIIAKDENFATLKMPSNEVRMLSLDCWATVGVLGNADYKNISWGKAGRTRNRGWRPSVRGMAMNPVDHPHGGGEGRSKSGSHPVTPWGKGCKGTRTRRKKDVLIIRRRK
ncbi:MAG TPA: 50S ribosomal protein L2 [Candidatus Saccharimonadales bacterium]|nr:50S ribosomal protein L2 [Candidatus Saccharimonadales bacterium]